MKVVLFGAGNFASLAWCGATLRPDWGEHDFAQRCPHFPPCGGGGATVAPQCFIGLNATVRDNVKIAQGCFIAASALVISDTEPDGLYVGAPARRLAKPASLTDQD